MVLLLDMAPDKHDDLPSPRAEGFPAGDFSAWLSHARKAIALGLGTDVDCGDCAACCRSSYFIHVKPEEAKALGAEAQKALAAAPGMPKGNKVLTFDEKGACALLKPSGCSVYAKRPQTCRNYDCRIFAAAGIAAGGDEKAGINARVESWIFSYPTARDRQEHDAVRAATAFIRGNAGSFPGGRVPGDPGQLAVLALKAYGVFLTGEAAPPGGTGQASSVRSDGETAAAIVAACRDFDAGETGAGPSPHSLRDS
jgi:uncharacterized protein